jgi:hypothetical protein
MRMLLAVDFEPGDTGERYFFVFDGVACGRLQLIERWLRGMKAGPFAAWLYEKRHFVKCALRKLWVL